MIDVHLDAAGMARVRLAVSPVSEVLHLLGLAAAGRRHPLFGDPGAASRSILSHRDVALVAALTQPDGTGYIPDLLTPKPSTGAAGSVLDRQLDAVASTPLDHVFVQLTDGRYRSGAMPRHIRAALESGTFGLRAANGLAVFWRAALADGWQTVRSSLEADLARRAETMARNGIGQVLRGLHPRLSFDGDRLHFASRFTEVNDLRGAELVLTPTVLGWPVFSLQTCDAANAVISYPAIGLGGRQVSDDHLTNLLGANRARILADLKVPRSTAELSTRHGLARATVSYHLGVLFKSGLLVRSRDGHYVRYRQSRHGQLISDSSDV